MKSKIALISVYVFLAVMALMEWQVTSTRDERIAGLATADEPEEQVIAEPNARREYTDEEYVLLRYEEFDVKTNKQAAYDIYKMYCDSVTEYNEDISRKLQILKNDTQKLYEYLQECLYLLNDIKNSSEPYDVKRVRIDNFDNEDCFIKLNEILPICDAEQLEIEKAVKAYEQNPSNEIEPKSYITNNFSYKYDDSYGLNGINTERPEEKQELPKMPQPVKGHFAGMLSPE